MGNQPVQRAYLGVPRVLGSHVLVNPGNKRHFDSRIFNYAHTGLVAQLVRHHG